MLVLECYRIKTSTSSVGVSSTEDSISISLEGPFIEEFDPTPAVESWLSSKHINK